MRGTAKRIAFGLAAAATLGTLAACGGGDSGSDSGTTLVWWHNGTNDPLLTVWQETADAYMSANPGTTIKVTPIQNEQFTTKVPLALQSNDPPDVYFNQGGGLLATQVQSGRVADLTEATKDVVSEIGASAAGWQVDGKQYGLPTSAHVVGFWYRKSLFSKAGIAQPPSTLSELNDAVGKLKAVGVAPIALGGKDRWPDAFYYNYFAVRECSVDTLKSSMKSAKFEDGCFDKAGQDVLDFIATKPFQDGFNGVPAQQGIGSSAGAVATGKAAMELQGDWDPSVMAGLSTDTAYKDDLGWFPFPTVEGGQGDPSAALGGGDGFSCTVEQADACVAFLKFINSVDVQKKLVSSGALAFPVNPQATSAITDPVFKQVFDYNNQASYVQVYFDIALPTAAGQALDDAAASMFAGQGGADAVSKAVNATES